MNRLQVWVRAVESVTHPVIFQSKGFVLRNHIALQYVTRVVVGVACLWVLIDVITQMQNHIEVGFAHVPIGVEEALRVV